MGGAAEVFAVFLRLGLTSFGGPIAHLGYFRDEFVVRRRWITDRDYGDLVALSQFLPGPTSSQTGFAIGLMRAGWVGGIAAFVAFTLPSALLLMAFAATAPGIEGTAGLGALQGLKLLAVAVVAQAVLGMARSLCPDAPRATIAFAALLAVALLPPAIAMVGAVVGGGLAGLTIWREAPPATAPAPALPVGTGIGAVALALLVALLVGLPLLSGVSQTLAAIDGYLRAGALVFGGGHVVLPMLEAELVAAGRVAPDLFVAGYGAAQAVPGPLFSVAAFFGFVQGSGQGGIAGAALALGAIFLPGFLVLIAALPWWARLRGLPAMHGFMTGANAAVVGILGAALHDPLFVGAVAGPRDLAVAVGLWVLLSAWKAPVWAVAIFAAGCGAVLAFPL
jgi:chromate transporter